jgi:lipoyl(octanoyl) transferase
VPPSPFDSESLSPALQAFLLGQVDFDRVLAVQQRLVEEAHQRGDGQIVLLLCEHPTIITIGRSGSMGDVATASGPIRSGQIEVRWVNRGGGAILHCPGQLAIYPIVPLRWHRFSVGEFLARSQGGIVEALDDLNVPTTTPGHTAVCGRTGQLATLGIAVRHWITYFGGYLNVCPSMGLFRLVEPKMSSLVAERRGAVRMTAVRAALVHRLAERFGCDRYHLHTGHPLLRTT